MIETDDTRQSPLIGHEFNAVGHGFHIVESARQSDGGWLRFDYCAPPGANISEHIHPAQEESFQVVSGTLGVRVGGRELILKAGQSAVGPPGVPHTWWNPSEDEEVCFVAGIRPGLDVETMLETVLGLARDGKTIGGVIPKNPLQLAVLVHEIGSWAYSPRIPRPVRKVLFAPVAVLAFFGRLLGYRARYSGYEPGE